MEDSQLGICDECLSREIVYDSILDCKATRLCRRCLNSSGAIDLGSARRSEVPQIALPTSKEVLCKMSGLNPKDWDSNKSDRHSQENINMDYLRMKKRERDLAAREEKEKQAREMAAAEAALAAYRAQAAQEPRPEQILQNVEQKIEKKSIFGMFRRKQEEPKIRPSAIESAEGPASDL